MRALSLPYKLATYYASFLVFGLLALALNAWCLLAGVLPDTPRRERFFQRRVHRQFACFVRWLSVVRIVPVHYEGFEQWDAAHGVVLAANHPGLMDIGFLLARVPEGICIYKPAVAHHPLYHATARRAGYLANDCGHHLLRAAAAKVAAGGTLIVFPEGTRTRGGGLNPLKPGFVAIARLARAPIQLVRITSRSGLLGKGRRWWQVPPLPAAISVTLGPRLPPPGPAETRAVVAAIEAWFRDGTPPPQHRDAPLDAARVHASS